ncbi:MAG TPA: hypothetical protein PL188_09250 [Candidatus Cloacimonadota bacterium]|nr:hypothetical protein [Candidatus Cloacimonadota bacterium]
MNRLLLVSFLLLLPLILRATEGFESGDFSAMHWQMEGHQPWTVQQSVVHSGSYSARSGVIGSTCNSTLVLTLNILEPGNVTFWFKSSSAQGDYFSFRVDSMLVDDWYGDLAWQQFSWAVQPGLHTFRWKYSKNDSVVHYSDCVWLDDITFPAFEPVMPPMADPQPFPVSLSLNQGQSGTADLSIGNLGQQTLSFNLQNFPETQVFLSESFEYDVPPAGWTNTFISGQVWRKNNGWDGHPASAYHGNYNAALFTGNNWTYAWDRLNSPVLDLSSVSQASLSFWHFQYIAGREVELKVYYRNSSSEDWVLLATYASHTPAWTQRVISLPNLSSTYQVAFEGKTLNGFGIHIDKIEVYSSLAEQPDWVSPGPLSSGSVAAGGSPAPANLAFNSSGLAPGVYHANMRAVQNNFQAPYVEIPVTLTVLCYPELTSSDQTLDFGLVAVGQQSTMQFTLSNPGAASLSGQAILPQGFYLALDAEESRRGGHRETMDFGLEPGASQTYNLTFIPDQMQDYGGELLITHNAPQPELSISILAAGGKAMLGLNSQNIHIQEPLGHEGSFPLGIANLGNLPLEYSISIEGQPHWLSFSGDWQTSGNLMPGSDSLFIDLDYIQDGLVAGTHYATLLLQTNAIDSPELVMPVEFEIINTPHLLNLPDSFSFFTGEELLVDLSPFITDADLQDYWFMASPYPQNFAVGGYDTMLRLYTYSDWTGEEMLNLMVFDNLGQFATDSVMVRVLPIPDSLDSPNPTITQQADYIRISWDAVSGARFYSVYRSTSPDGGFTWIGDTFNLYWDDPEDLPHSFYYVKAVYQPLRR